MLTLLHSERPKLHTILAFLGAVGLSLVSLRVGSGSGSFSRIIKTGTRQLLCSAYVMSVK